MNEYKRKAIEQALDEREGELAVMIRHDESPAEIRSLARERGVSNEMYERLWDYSADRIGASELI